MTSGDAQLRKQLTALVADVLNGDPLQSLGAARDLRTFLYEHEGVFARAAVEAGASWEEIGALLGVSRQAAWTRYREGRPETTAIREARERVEKARKRIAD